MATGSSGWQTGVAVQPAPGVEGDFATANPRFNVLAGPGALVAGAAGVRIGYFAWLSSQAVDADNAPAIVNSFGSGPVAGFVHREQQGLNTSYLSYAGMMIPPGFPVTLHSGGDFWVTNNGSAAAQIGQKAYADLATGKVSFAATGAPTTASVTGAIAANTFSVTGAIAGNVMTVTAVGSGTVQPGPITGSGITSGTKVVKQLTPLLSGEALGGIGRYALNVPEQTVASETINGTYGTLTVSAVSSGTVGVGGVVAGSGVTTGTAIVALGTGAGGTGTYIVDTTQTVGSEALTVTQNVETKWIAMSSGLAGELVKISSQPLG
jgi:hypothetical protein